MNRRMLLKVCAALGLGYLARGLDLFPASASDSHRFEVTKSEMEWRAILTPQQYKVLREEWTEPPYRNPYHDSKASGTYVCAGCELPLFSSATKYDSRTGWPSFWEPVKPSAVGTRTDFKLIYPRTEVHCARCGGHLGHIFKDGPPPTGLRYCINSAALNFVPSA